MWNVWSTNLVAVLLYSIFQVSASLGTCIVEFTSCNYQIWKCWIRYIWNNLHLGMETYLSEYKFKIVDIKAYRVAIQKYFNVLFKLEIFSIWQKCHVFVLHKFSEAHTIANLATKYGFRHIIWHFCQHSFYQMIIRLWRMLHGICELSNIVLVVYSCCFLIVFVYEVVMS